MSFQNSKHRAFSLVELLIVMAIGAGIMGLLGMLFARIVQAHSTATEHSQDLLILDRLSEQFRRDVHGVMEASLDRTPQPSQGLRLLQPGGSAVQYELTHSGVQRSEASGDKIERREEFLLSSIKVLGFENHRAQDGELSMLLSLGRDDERAPAKRFKITARVGLDQSW